MTSEDQYIKASHYDLKAQRHNRGVFHRWLLAHPGWALVCALSMGLLGVNAALNLFGAPRWHRYPWTGWMLGGAALLMACYFLVSAMRGWWAAASSSPGKKPTGH